MAVGQAVASWMLPGLSPGGVWARSAGVAAPSRGGEGDAEVIRGGSRGGEALGQDGGGRWGRNASIAKQVEEALGSEMAREGSRRKVRKL